MSRDEVCLTLNEHCAKFVYGSGRALIMFKRYLVPKEGEL
jgi:hypothetical protein